MNTIKITAWIPAALSFRHCLFYYESPKIGEKGFQYKPTSVCDSLGKGESFDLRSVMNNNFSGKSFHQHVVDHHNELMAVREHPLTEAKPKKSDRRNIIQDEFPI